MRNLIFASGLLVAVAAISWPVAGQQAGTTQVTAASSALSPAQQTAVTAMTSSLATLSQAATTARTGLNSAAFGGNAAAIQANVEALAAAELALANARAAAFESLQASANKLAPDQIPGLIQQVAGGRRGAAPAPQVAPGTVGPKEGGAGDRPLPEMKPVVWAPGKPRVLMIGGGSSHPYNDVYNPLDTAILEAVGYTVNYTEDRDQASAELKGADVAILSVNRRYFDAPEYRKALSEFVAAGKGIVLLHAGVWRMWPEWNEFYGQVVGGWATSHDRLGPFSVTVTEPTHPVMKDVPAKFDVVDELYHMNAEPQSTQTGTAAIQILAQTQPSARYMQPHAAVWVVNNPTARIVGITLGHDERVHNLPAFKTLLANAVRWTSKK